MHVKSLYLTRKMHLRTSFYPNLILTYDLLSMFQQYRDHSSKKLIFQIFSINNALRKTLSRGDVNVLAES